MKKIEPKGKRIMREDIRRVLQYGKYRKPDSYWHEHPRWFKQILKEIINQTQR